MDWIQIVSSLGFPIVAAGACFWFVKYLTDKNREELKEQREELKEELKEQRENHAKEMEKFSTALENNTNAVNQLNTLIQTLLMKEGTK